MARPDSAEQLTFSQYFAKFSLLRQKPASLLSAQVEKDKLLNFVVPRQGSHIHVCVVLCVLPGIENLPFMNLSIDTFPAVHSMEDFFFNLLLAEKPFRSLSQLKSPQVESYFQQFLMNDNLDKNNVDQVRQACWMSLQLTKVY